ncbi:MAG TPA: hypothetical protein VFO60_12255, partial [Candidatus Dormibacteraeota bacterium]|nr:hypothetical protein [Candidatus Dormibacteraeota bacterium]
MGYQQGGPPQGYQPAPQPAQKQPVDIQAIVGGFTTGEQLLLGGAVLWIIFSFIGSWLSASYSCPANFSVSC